VIALLGVLACDEPEIAPIPVTLEVEDPWVLVSQDASEVAIRFGETGDGVRIWTASGTSPVHAGRTLDGPLIAWPYPDRLDRVEVRVQGIDLVVRAYGPPIHSVTGRDDAPDDPILTWVRYRPRGEDWRVVVDGLGVITLPAPIGPITASEGGFTWSLQASDARFALDTNAPAWSSRIAAGAWVLDLGPSLAVQQPYPRTGLTWTPLSPSPTPP
jgi:hypothetical protein